MKEKTVHLNRYYHFTELMKDPAVSLSLSRYRSRFDGTTQSIMILEPSYKKADKLFFFFHGMDGDCGDGVILRDLVKGVNAKLICIGGRGASWVSDAFIADAIQAIKKHKKGINKYYLIGVSMGGTQALTLAALLPEKVKKDLFGIIALIPGTDLPAIAKMSSHERVRRTLMLSAAGNIKKLTGRSPDRLIAKYRDGLPFAIFYTNDDTILLSEKTNRFISELNKKCPVSVFKTRGGHEFTYKNFDYKKVFESLGHIKK